METYKTYTSGRAAGTVVLKANNKMKWKTLLFSSIKRTYGFVKIPY